MPGNSFSFTIRVGSEIHIPGADILTAQLFNNLFLIVHINISRRKTALYIDTELIPRQIAEMAAAGKDLIFFAEKLLNCLSLGGRFDNDQILRVLRQRFQLL